MITVRLPWPLPYLSPNSRAHWSNKAKQANWYRHECGRRVRDEIAALHDEKSSLKALNERGVCLSIRFCPPDKRRRDLDNMLASIKAGIDGIADALGVDDQHFSLRLERGEPKKGGEVVAVITEGEQA